MKFMCLASFSVQLLTELQVRAKSVFLNLLLSCQRPCVDAGDDLYAKRHNPFKLS